MVESALFIGGYFIQAFGNGLLLAQVFSKKSVYGLSTETQVAYLISTLCRCVWALDTRLVETYIAYLELILSVAVSVALLYCTRKYKHTNIGKKSTRFSGIKAASTLILGALALAILIHPGNRFWSIQILVAFSIYLEAVALLPQLALMRRMIEIEPLTTHSVTLIVLSRVIRLGFWLSLFYQGENFFGLFLADLLHCIFTADYLVNWVRKFRPRAAMLIKY